MVRFDYHAHTTYSDGAFLPWMVRAAEDAGLAGIGFADHCNVSEREAMVRRKERMGFNLDVTHERRRSAIERAREEASIAVFDAVELDYDPRDEAAIADFLDTTDFDYAVGSVHFVEGQYVGGSGFADRSEAERRAVLDTYYDRVVALAESGLFDVAAHLDLPERHESFRRLSTPEDYERVAAAFADSPTVPEINAGRAEDGYFLPKPAFVETLQEAGVAFTAGTDAHRPDGLRAAVPLLRDRFDELGIDPVTVVEG